MYLHCIDNQLTNLDVSKNTELLLLRFSDNKLTRLNIVKNTKMVELYCGFNQLTNLDITKNTELVILKCDGNQLSNLDVSKNLNLTDIHCRGNQFTSSALNNLFEMLSNNGGYIFISGNPGSTDCDTGIAKRKRWNVIVNDRIEEFYDDDEMPIFMLK
jgi:hypothetical protein